MTTTTTTPVTSRRWLLMVLLAATTTSACLNGACETFTSPETVSSHGETVQVRDLYVEVAIDEDFTDSQVRVDVGGKSVSFTPGIDKIGITNHRIITVKVKVEGDVVPVAVYRRQLLTESFAAGDTCTYSGKVNYLRDPLVFARFQGDRVEIVCNQW